MARKIVLDLHMVRHKDVSDTLSNYFFFKGNKAIGAFIITGDSEPMRELVVKWLKEWDFTYEWINWGQLKITG